MVNVLYIEVHVKLHQILLVCISLEEAKKGHQFYKLTTSYMTTFLHVYNIP